MVRFVYWLVVALGSFLGPAVLKILKSLGWGIVAFIGATAALNAAESWIFSQYNGLPSLLYSMLTIMGFDVGIKMIFAAYAMRVAAGVTMATKQTWNAPPGASGGSSGTLGA